MLRTTTLLLAFSFCASLFAATGGPDAYGYIWKDSNEADGPVFNWIDITTTGTMVTGLGDDNVVGPFVMSTDMPYYWYGRKFVWVGSNGYIAFNGGNIASPFPSIPLAGGVNDYVAGMATDLNFLGTGNNGRCYFFDDDDLTIISWVDVPFWNAATDYSGSNTFEIILNKTDSSITVQYLQQVGTVANGSLAIGIESVAGSIGLQHSFNTYPATNYAIRYYMPPSSSLQIRDGTVAWNTAPGSGGVFRSRNGAPLQLVSTALNVGNTPLTNFTLDGRILNGAGATVVSQLVPISQLLPELDTTITFTPVFDPTIAGTFRFVSTVGAIASELVTDNNQLTQEIVVVDTTTATQDLRYHGPTDNLAGIGWDGGDGGVGVYIKPPYYPAYATHTTIRIASDAGLAGYTIKVFDDDGPGGAPGTMLDSVQVPLGSVTVGDQVLPLSAPLMITSGGVYIQWYMLGPNVNIAVDANPPFSLRTYEVIGNIWAEYRDRTVQDFFLGLRLSQVPVHDIGCTGFFGLADGQDVPGQTAVRAWVTNLGNQPASGFTVNYRFANGPVVSQAYTGPVLNPGAAPVLFTFSSYFIPTADLTADLCAWTTMVDDASALNDTACVSIHTFVGIEELDALGVVLAPNPADASVRINGLPSGMWTLRLMDATGRLVRTESFSLVNGPLVLGVEDLVGGAYQMLLDNGTGRWHTSLIVQH
ncbi:MAG: hypothetical protein IPL52_10025 [Flavobacteriales bacterium]|nr:hypothetical protein [Flavobacteriales bacterium]